MQQSVQNSFIYAASFKEVMISLKYSRVWALELITMSKYIVCHHTIVEEMTEEPHMEQGGGGGAHF